MNEWVIPLLSAIAGAGVAVGIRELVEWLRKPNLKIDFEEHEGQKPYILDLFLESVVTGAFEREKAKFLRLNVRNAGRKPAMNCEAKMVLLKNGSKEPLRLSLHWSRRDPATYKTLDEIYKPIHLNARDEEPVDLLMLHYCLREPLDYLREDSIVTGKFITSMSPREYSFERNTAYRIQVTVYASNTISKPFNLKLYWDGTLEGFNGAVEGE